MTNKMKNEFHKCSLPRLALLIFSVSCISGCVAPFVPSDSDDDIGKDYVIDVTIVSDPPGAAIFSVPQANSDNGDSRISDWGYMRFGFQKQLVGSTPYHGTVTVSMKARGSLSSYLHFEDDHNCMCLFRDLQLNRNNGLYSYQYRELYLSYELVMLGYQSTVVSDVVVKGDLTPVQFFKEAAAQKIEKGQLLKPLTKY